MEKIKLCFCCIEFDVHMLKLRDIFCALNKQATKLCHCEIILF